MAGCQSFVGEGVFAGGWGWVMRGLVGVCNCGLSYRGVLECPTGVPVRLAFGVVGGQPKGCTPYLGAYGEYVSSMWVSGPWIWAVVWVRRVREFLPGWRGQLKVAGVGSKLGERSVFWRKVWKWGVMVVSW